MCWQFREKVEKVLALFPFAVCTRHRASCARACTAFVREGYVVSKVIMMCA